MSCQSWNAKLDAYVDGEGSREDLAAAQAHIDACTDCAREALRRIQLKRATQAAAQRYTPAPEFRLRVQRSIRKSNKPAWSFAWGPSLITAFAMMLLVATSGLVWTRHIQREQALAELLDLHVATLASANPVDVISTDRHTVKPWFQGKLPFTFNLPELAKTPFKLVGGRVAYLNHSPSAQLLFTTGNHQLSVFVVQDSSLTAAKLLDSAELRERGFSIETWSANGLRYAIVGDSGPSDLRALSELLKAAERL